MRSNGLIHLFLFSGNPFHKVESTNTHIDMILLEVALVEGCEWYKRIVEDRFLMMEIPEALPKEYEEVRNLLTRKGLWSMGSESK